MSSKLLALLALILGLSGTVGCNRRDGTTPHAGPERDPNSGSGHSPAVPKSGLVASSSPNPCDQHTHPSMPRPPFPYMWIYSTEVRNTLDVPLRITSFEAYVQKDGKWVAGNVMGRTLTAREFDEWYSDGLKIANGVIPPGEVALNAVNWHGSEKPTHGRTKWAFWAVDPEGKEHYAEVVVESVSIEDKAVLKDADAYAKRANVWMSRGKFGEAIGDLDAALQLQPTAACLWNNRGFAWHMNGVRGADRPSCEDRALSDYAQAIRLDPKHASAINNRPWLIATSKVDRCRNGRLAIEEATKACELSAWKNAGFIDTLSVAYAEVGDFERAIRWQKKALEDPAYTQEQAGPANEKLALFKKKPPLRE